jgi:Transcriptional regulators
MAATRDPRPRSQQIAAELRADIMSGDLPPGSQLPSTADLAATYQAPGATIQNAVAILKQEGYVEGQPGRGVFVRPAEPGQPYAWITVAAGRGQHGTSRLLDVGEVPAPAQVAAAIGIDPGTPVVRRRQLLLLDGQPVELVHAYYPTDLARDTPLADRRRLRGGSPAVLAALGVPPKSYEDTISTRPPTPEELIALDLPQGVPVLRTLRAAVAASGRTVEVLVLIKAGHRHQVMYRWPAG